MTVMYCT